MRTRALTASLVALVLSACGGQSRFLAEDSGSAATDDTGAEADVGFTDAGSHPDGGSRPDAGTPADVALATDVGVASDAGGTPASDAAVGACMARDLGSAVGNAVATGSTAGESAYEGSCGGDGAPEAVLAWTAPSDGDFTFTTEGSDIDTVLYLNDGACDGEEVDCNDDTLDSDDKKALWSSVTATLRRGQRVFVFVDGYSDRAGDWTLNVTSP